MNRLARKVALVADNQLRNDPGLSTIVSLHSQMQRVPRTKASPVDDLNGVRQSTGNEATITLIDSLIDGLDTATTAAATLLVNDNAIADGPETCSA